MKSDRLVTFLYILMRDYLPTGKVEEIMLKHVTETEDKEVRYSSAHLAALAKEIAERLKSAPKFEGELHNFSTGSIYGVPLSDVIRYMQELRMYSNMDVQEYLKKQDERTESMAKLMVTYSDGLSRIREINPASFRVVLDRMDPINADQYPYSRAKKRIRGNWYIPREGQGGKGQLRMIRVAGTPEEFECEECRKIFVGDKFEHLHHKCSGVE